jgi:hypothetical protein
MPEATDEEKLIDAKLEEVDQLLEELRQRRKELLEAKEAVTMQQQTLPGPPAFERRPSPRRADAELEEILQSLTWKSFKRKEGEWTFLRDREGNLRDELDSVTDFVNQLRKGKDVVVGKYRYSLSEDRFLNRYPALPK